MKTLSCILALLFAMAAQVTGQIIDPSTKAAVSAQVDGDAAKAITEIRQAIIQAEAKNERGEVARLEQRLVGLLVRAGQIQKARALAAKLSADQGPASLWAQRWLAALGTPRGDNEQEPDAIMDMLRVLETNDLKGPAGLQVQDLIFELGPDSDAALAAAIPKLNVTGMSNVLDALESRLERDAFAPLIVALCQSNHVVKRQIGASSLCYLSFDNLRPHLAELLQNNDIAVVSAALERLQSFGDKKTRGLSGIAEVLVAAARRCCFTPNRSRQDIGINSLRFEFLKNHAEVDVILLEVIEKGEDYYIAANAVALWISRRRENKENSAVVKLYESSSQWVKKRILLATTKADKSWGKIVDSGLADSKLKLAAAGAALKIGQVVPDALLLERFDREPRPSRKLATIANARQAISDELAREVLENVFQMEKTGRRPTNPTTVRQADKRARASIDFVLAHNPKVLWEMAGALLWSRANTRIEELCLQGKNAVLSRSILLRNPKRNLRQNNGFVARSQPLKLALACATQENFIDLVKVVTAYPFGFIGVFPDQVFEGIEKTIRAQHLRQYLQDIEESQWRMRPDHHRRICVLFLSQTKLSEEEHGTLIRNFILKHSKNEKLREFMAPLVYLLGFKGSQSKDFLWQLIEDFDGPIDAMAFGTLKRLKPKEKDLVALQLRGVRNLKCTAVFQGATPKSLRKDKDYQTLYFDRWVTNGPSTLDASQIGDLKIVEEAHQFATLKRLLVLEDYKKCNVILRARSWHGLLSDSEKLLPFYGDVLATSDNKQDEVELRKTAIYWLGRQFTIEAVEVLVEALRDSDKENAKQAKSAIERIKLYLQEKESLRQLKRDKKLIEMGLKVK